MSSVSIFACMGAVVAHSEHDAALAWICECSGMVEAARVMGVYSSEYEVDKSAMVYVYSGLSDVWGTVVCKLS